MLKNTLLKNLILLIGLMLVATTHVQASPSFLGSLGGTVYTVTDGTDTYTYTVKDRSRESDGDIIGGIGYLNTNTSPTDITQRGFTGYYIGTVINYNDSETDILNLVRIFLGNPDFEFESSIKVDIDDGVASDNDNLKIEFTLLKDDEPIAGSWELNSSDSTK